MRRIFKTRAFQKLLKSVELSDRAIRSAVVEMEAGLIDADLGGNVYKKRIALPGGGKSGGARTIIAAREGGHWFFMYAFAKSEKDNIGQDELQDFRDLAKGYLGLTDAQIDQLIANSKVYEVLR